ncbi:ribbon-helix-helix protein, CopG family [Pseudonocardia nigra]|uniref:ribbon-helix-helix protein, CopG family n=1 Tax=Pseudonocardia nigra TaxID=1921578 RepID=UPI001C5E70BB|nr:ribbon-helix-helix protein, CopG family [Pseudonocardia nigra]
MLDRRLQILLDEQRYQRVAALAAARGISVGAVVREAIDRGLTATPNRRATAARRLLDAAPMPASAPEDLRAELEELRGRRG